MQNEGEEERGENEPGGVGENGERGKCAENRRETEERRKKEERDTDVEREKAFSIFLLSLPSLLLSAGSDTTKTKGEKGRRQNYYS
jgi:hypothetical protein